MGNLNTKEYDIELLIIEINKKFKKNNTNFVTINKQIDNINNILSNLSTESPKQNDLDFTWDYYEIQTLKKD